MTSAARGTADPREFTSQKFTGQLFALRIATVLTPVLTRDRGESKGEYAIKTSEMGIPSQPGLRGTLRNSASITRINATACIAAVISSDVDASRQKLRTPPDRCEALMCSSC